MIVAEHSGKLAEEKEIETTKFIQLGFGLGDFQSGGGRFVQFSPLPLGAEG
jgi:hypothetical protein